MRQAVTGVVRDLFPLFMERPAELPKQWRKDVAEAEGETALARIVADYIAGMTDRFAIETHGRLLGSDMVDRTRALRGRWPPTRSGSHPLSTW